MDFTDPAALAKYKRKLLGYHDIDEDVANHKEEHCLDLIAKLAVVAGIPSISTAACRITNKILQDEFKHVLFQVMFYLSFLVQSFSDEDSYDDEWNEIATMTTQIVQAALPISSQVISAEGRPLQMNSDVFAYIFVDLLKEHGDAKRLSVSTIDSRVDFSKNAMELFQCYLEYYIFNLLRAASIFMNAAGRTLLHEIDVNLAAQSAPPRRFCILQKRSSEIDPSHEKLLLLSIHKLCKRVFPEYTLTRDALLFLHDINDHFLTCYTLTAINLVEGYATRCVISSWTADHLLRFLVPPGSSLSRECSNTATKAITIYCQAKNQYNYSGFPGAEDYPAKKKQQEATGTRNSLSNMIFNIYFVEILMKMLCPPSFRIGSTAPMYFAAVLEALTYKIIQLTVKYLEGKGENSHEIDLLSIHSAIDDSKEIKDFFALSGFDYQSTIQKKASMESNVATEGGEERQEEMFLPKDSLPALPKLAPSFGDKNFIVEEDIPPKLNNKWDWEYAEDPESKLPQWTVENEARIFSPEVEVMKEFLDSTKTLEECIAKRVLDIDQEDEESKAPKKK
jgi:histone H3/H4